MTAALFGSSVCGAEAFWGLVHTAPRMDDVDVVEDVDDARWHPELRLVKTLLVLPP